MNYTVYTDQKLMEIYARLNRDFFANGLPIVPIGWSWMQKKDQDCRAFTSYFDPLAIVFNVELKPLYKKCSVHLATTMLHEMVHIKLAAKHRAGAAMHGRLFAKELAVIGQNPKLKHLF